MREFEDIQGFMHSFKKTTLWVMTCALVMATTLVRAEHKKEDLPESCDLKLYETMEHKSYLEAKRETEIAERLILKPDSVLEYSCFKEYVTDYWPKKAKFFSVYGGGTNVPENSMKDAIENVVMKHTQNYIENLNFGHYYLGGTALFTKEQNPDGEFDTSTACAPMRYVWHISKCSNIGYDYVTVKDPNTGNEKKSLSAFHFFKLRDLYTNDYRTFPLKCANTDARKEKIKNAQKELNTYARAQNGHSVDDATKYDNNKSYTERLQKCDTSPIPTGYEAYFLNKDRKTRRKVIDHICTTPGCVYDGSGACKNNGIPEAP